MRNLSAEQESEIRNCIAAIRKGDAVLFPDEAGWCIACDLYHEERRKQIMQLESASYPSVLVAETGMLVRHLTEIPETLEDLVAYSSKPMLFMWAKPLNIPGELTANNSRVAFRVAAGMFTIRFSKGFGKALFSSFLPGGTSAPVLPEGILKSHTYVVNLRKPAASIPDSMVIVELGPGNLIRFIRK